MSERLVVTIQGRVQGVWFRGSLREQALERDCKGFVRNEHDGSIYLEVEGERSNLETLLAWCREGPPLAEVTHVEALWLPARGDFTSFTIE